MNAAVETRIGRLEDQAALLEIRNAFLSGLPADCQEAAREAWERCPQAHPNDTAPLLAALRVCPPEFGRVFAEEYRQRVTPDTGAAGALMETLRDCLRIAREATGCA